jgi:glycosyltransferase involved in cell wall biosynthesis
MSDRLFVAWHPHSRRGQLFADAFDMPLYKIHAIGRRWIHAPFKYPIQAWRTWQLLNRKCPRMVFVQNPPIFAAVVVYLYCRRHRARFIIDSHTGALLLSLWRWSLPLHGFLSRQAVTTIVTNEHLRRMVEGWGAHATIVADIPTEFPAGNPFPLDGRFTVVVINTFSPDEPVGEVLDAAAALPDVGFYVTGDPVRARRAWLEHAPSNVHFTGFLLDPDYFGLLRAAQAVLVLTTDNHTMQRGACEALSLGKPIITSNWPLLREYFNKGTIYVDNTSRGIQVAVRQMQAQQGKLAQEILDLRQERSHEWEAKREEIITLITRTTG